MLLNWHEDNMVTHPWDRYVAKTSCFYRFIVDRRIFVVGFGLYGSIHGPSEYQVNIQIIHTGSGKPNNFYDFFAFW